MIALTFVAAFMLVTMPAFAVQNGQAGKSNVAHLNLYEKNPADWTVVEGGAWGKMKYNLSGETFDFVFNGHGLTVGAEYSLIYYADPWPGDNPGALIGSGTVNEDGDIHIAGSEKLNIDIPHTDDANYPGGAKIWLVTSADYNSGTNAMTGWNPTEYLFENNLIQYDDTDL